MLMRCTVCNWIYDEEEEGISFADLPPEYTCPVCGAPKAAFEPVSWEQSAEGNVADALIRGLVDLGVRKVYGIPGDSNLPLVEALRENPDIELVLTRHESTAAFMASAHAKLTGEIGVCLSIAGPGATNLVTGLMDAAADRAPVLALVGQVSGIFLGSEAFQEIDQIEMFRPFAVFAETLSLPSQLPRLFGMAVKAAYGGPGVAVLSMPTDTLSARPVDENWDKGNRLFRGTYLPEDEDLQRAESMINSAEKPALFAGWGSRRDPDALYQLATSLNAPVATTSRAKGVFPETHPLSLGVLGSIGNPHAPRALAEADLLVVLGSGFRQRNLLTDVPIIQIDHDPVRLGRNFPVELGLVGDVAATIRALLPNLTEDASRVSLDEEVERARSRWQSDIVSDASSDGSVHPNRLIQALKRNLQDDAVVTVDVGDHTYWFYQRFQCESQLTLMSASMASMGFALPAALAASLAMPERQVVCLAGDGGFGMLMADFTTAVLNDLDISVILFNDYCLKNIKKEQRRDGYPDYGVEFANPNFADFASSAGGLGIKVESEGQLDEAIAEALSHPGPALLDVRIDPDAMLGGVKIIPKE
ncbi:MAG: thiamine pyrophosphate-binding protein [Bacillota bacterium]